MDAQFAAARRFRHGNAFFLYLNHQQAFPACNLDRPVPGKRIYRTYGSALRRRTENLCRQPAVLFFPESRNNGKRRRSNQNRYIRRFEKTQGGKLSCKRCFPAGRIS